MQGQLARGALSACVASWLMASGVEEGRGTIGLAAVAAGEKLGEQLVHFAREAVAARAAQRGIVPIT